MDIYFIIEQQFGSGTHQKDVLYSQCHGPYDEKGMKKHYNAKGNGGRVKLTVVKVLAEEVDV